MLHCQLNPCCTWDQQRRHLEACWEWKLSYPIPELQKQNLHFNKISRWFLSTFKFQKHWTKTRGTPLEVGGTHRHSRGGIGQRELKCNDSQLQKCKAPVGSLLPEGWRLVSQAEAEDSIVRQWPIWESKRKKHVKIWTENNFMNYLPPIPHFKLQVLICSGEVCWNHYWVSYLPGPKGTSGKEALAPLK